MKTKIKTFTDGRLEYGTIGTKRDDKTKDKTGVVFFSLGVLFFNLSYIRQQDVDIHGINASTVDLKLNTYYVKGVNESHKVKIDENIYNISKLDIASDKQTLYWYLSKWNGENNDR